MIILFLVQNFGWSDPRYSPAEGPHDVKACIAQDVSETTKPRSPSAKAARDAQKEYCTGCGCERDMKSVVCR